ncbi:uncharacterized protein N7496_000607 [Penicillium cataractarum]|uniref:Uncharacterized protein n=1 Tax=Penicillium cataractarum TaxID=2100454 RepID=A0A9X0B631_9EURO|nr:uncharacterized protein N7496_000607 [Penicillium cataractarum]KAJ5389539.1 hypothetical protein N7496_000607 [Penicillium cataractarum]
MEAITVLASFTFLLALVVAGVTVITFWRKHRIQFQITDKSKPVQERGRIRERDLESAEQEMIPAPAPCVHPRLESLQNPRRFPTYPPARSDNPSLRPQVSPITHTFTPFTAATIPEDPFERAATPGSISHFAPATNPRDPQGFPEQKP